MFDSLKQIIQQMQEGKKISTTEEFDRIITSFGMSCKRSTTYLEQKSFVQEIWTSVRFPFFLVSRVYDPQSPIFDSLSPKEKKELLSKMLEQEVSVENYEMASVFRDKINSI